MEEKIEIMNLLQNKQILKHELQSLAYGSVEIRENNSNKYIYTLQRRWSCFNKICWRIFR